MAHKQRIDSLSHLHAIKRPRSYELVYALDIETGSKGQLLDIGLATPQGFRVFKDWKGFFSWLRATPHKTDARIAAHHGFGFDYIGMIQYLLSHLEQEGIEDRDITFLSSEALVIALIIRMGDRKITFIDTMRFFPGQSLNSVAKDFLNEQKSDVPGDFISRMEDYKKHHRAEYYEYLRNDCDLLRRVYETFRDRVNEIETIGELGLSSGSTALRCFRRYMSRGDFFIFSCPKDLLGSADKAMRGGLTLYIGDGKEVCGEYKKVYHYDVISMYPSVMRYVPVPTAPLVTTTEPFIPRKKGERYAPGWYLCDYRQTRGRVPVLYGVDDDDPSFESQGILSHFDMEFLRRFGKVDKIHEAVLFPDYVYPFNDYLNAQLKTRVEAKRQGHKAESAALKVLLNSLYGKFAQKARREEMAITADVDWYDTRVAAQVAARGRSNAIEYYHSEKCVLYGVEADTTTFSNRFIGGLVTSLARLKLGVMYNTVETIYCDTDSIFSQQQIPDCFLGNEPGDFEFCDDSPSDMVCAGKKSYRYGDDIKFKGIPKDLITPEDMNAIKRGEKIIKTYRSPTALKTALKKSVKNPNEFLNHTRTVRASKSMKCQGILRLKEKLFSVKTAQDFLRFILC